MRSRVHVSSTQVGAGVAWWPDWTLSTRELEIGAARGKLASPAHTGELQVQGETGICKESSGGRHLMSTSDLHMHLHTSGYTHVGTHTSSHMHTSMHAHTYTHKF